MKQLNKNNSRGRDVVEVNWSELWFTGHQDYIAENFIPADEDAIGYMNDGGLTYKIKFDEDYVLYWLTWFIYNRLDKTNEWLDNSIENLGDINQEEKEKELKSKLEEIVEEQYQLLGQYAPSKDELRKRIINNALSQ